MRGYWGDIGGLYGIWIWDMGYGYEMLRSRRVNDRETVPFL